MKCPPPQELQQLLDEALPAEQHESIQSHLESCTTCQLTIEKLAAGGITWDKAAQNLADVPTRDETALINALQRLDETPTSAEITSGEARSQPLEEDLSFLQPAQKPGSLGRLDEFEILSVVGKGGFGIVLRAFDETLHRVVAIKVMLPHLAASGTARSRFNKEAKAAAVITHDNVVTIHAVAKKDAKVPYLVMQFISGVTLNEKIDKGGPLPVKEILRIGTQIAEGLAAAQKQGLIHRDIKPGNILLENGIERVKITDFGLARLADDASITQSGTVAGTPMYMSPEQANGDPVDHRSDLFSLGSVLYAMCTGRPPFRATTTMAVMKRVCDDTPKPVHEVNNDIPEWLSAIVAKLHAKKPEERYQSAKEVAELLGERLAHMQQPTHPALPIVPAQTTVDAQPVESTVPRRDRIGYWLLLLGCGILSLGVVLQMSPQTRLAGWIVAALGIPFLLGAIRVFFEKNLRLQLGAGALVVVGVVVLSIRYPLEDRMEAHEVLPRLVGTWEIEFEMTLPKPRKASGVIRYEWLPNEKYLRAYTNYDHGEETLSVYHFDPESKQFRKWFFGSEPSVQSIQGPGSGRFDEKSQTLTWRDTLPFHKITTQHRWIDADNFESHIEIKDQHGAVVLRQTKKMHRLTTNQVVGPKLPPDPKRPAEMADFDRMTGTWTTTAEVTLGDKKVQSRSTTRDRTVLAGRFVESREHTEGSKRDDYIVIGYDEFRKSYRLWQFSSSGDYMEADGHWNKNDNSVKWKSLDGRLTGSWTLRTPDERHAQFAVKDADGRRLYDVVVIARREVAGDEGWVQLFTGKNLDGWKKSDQAPGEWKVDNGLLVGSGKLGYLFSERGDYENFHLRVEAKLNAKGDSGVFFRSRFDPLIQQVLPTKVKTMSPAGYEAQLNNHAATIRTGCLFVTKDENDPTRTGEKGELVQPDEWCTLDIIADGPWISVSVNGKPTVNNYRDDTHARGHIALQVWNADTVVHFKKIAIKELPGTSSPKVPESAEQVLPFLVGNWKGEFTQKIFAGLPLPRKLAAAAVVDWAIDQKWLRQRVYMEDGGFVSLVNLEPGATVFRDWFFHAKGLIFGPSAGRWDPRTRTLTLTNLPENGVVVVTTWRVLDADTVTSESIIRDKEGKTLFEMGLHLKRTTESVRIDETTAAEPLPPQMAVLDRLVGDCQITGVLKDAENPDGLKAAWQSRAHRLLGGRLIATQSIGHPRYKDTFALSTFDVHANAYRRWMFQPDGNVLEYGGGWDEKTQTMKWHWAGKDGSQSTNTWRFSDANRLDWQVVTKDAVGKTTLDFQATSIHQSQPGWVSLFNGKDLNGWVGNSGTWKVGKNGMIGTGVEKKNPPQHLSTARSDRENFHLRLQAHLNPGGSGAIAFRVGKGADASKGIAIQLRHSKPGELEIHPFTMPNPYYVFGSVTKPLKADHWFELEIKADGPRIEILLDGQPASVHTYLPIGAALLDARGAIQLRLDNAKTTLSVRKIEIMELPRKEPDGVSLLNGVDLTGWKMLGHPGWTFKDGVLRGVGQSGKPGILMTEREFADYELELEYKLTKQTDSGIFLRAWPEGNLYGDDFIEVQLIDNASFPKLAADRMHGGLARRAAPKSEAAVALDAWRQAKVRHEGSRVKVWMDASLTVDADIADFPAKGRIGLQLFPQPIEFRNIRIRELKPAAAP